MLRIVIEDVRVSQNLSRELVAPCGMNCALCSAYLALKHDLKSKGIRMPYCEGCRIRGKKCSFLKKKCELLLSGRVEFCYECNDFPCERLEHLDARYRTHFHMSLIENLEFLKKNGMPAFLVNQRKKWQCPTCNDTVCCHNGICFNCGIQKLRSKKKLYRWEEK